MTNTVILLRPTEDATLTFHPPIGDASALRLYAKTVEEHCIDLLEEARFELVDGELETAGRILQRQVYFAKTALGVSHRLTILAERALSALRLCGTATISLIILDKIRFES